MPYTHASHSPGQTFLALFGIALLGFVGWELFVPQPAPEATAPTKLSAPAPVETADAESEAKTEARPAHAERAPGPGLFKCVSRGRTEYSDSPCPEGAKEVVVDATPAARGIEPLRSKPRPPLPEPTPQAAAGIAARETPAPDMSMQCRAIDEEIRAIDARARQYHSSAEGSRLNEQRRRAMDRRFSLNC